MYPLHDLWQSLATASLAIVGFVANEYVPIVGTVAVTVSAINGLVTLWRSFRGKPHRELSP